MYCVAVFFTVAMVVLVVLLILDVCFPAVAEEKPPPSNLIESVEEMTITRLAHEMGKQIVEEDYRSYGLSQYCGLRDLDQLRSMWLGPDCAFRHSVGEGLRWRTFEVPATTVIEVAEYPDRAFTIPHDSSLRPGHRRLYRVFRDSNGKICYIKSLS